MTEYFALANDKCIQLDTRNEQLEIYETRRAANLAGWGKELKVVEVSVVKRETYDSLQRERDALRKTLIQAHSISCAPENCRLDGGIEHEMAFTEKSA